jgi:hypothetical protein
MTVRRVTSPSPVFAERAGAPIRFVPYLLTAFPLMILAIAISQVYVSLRYV